MSIVDQWDITRITNLIGKNPIQKDDWVKIIGRPSATFYAYTGPTLNFSVPVTIDGDSIKADDYGSDGNYYYITAHLEQVGGDYRIFGAVLRTDGADDDGGQWDGNRKP